MASPPADRSMHPRPLPRSVGGRRPVASTPYARGRRRLAWVTVLWFVALGGLLAAWLRELAQYL